MEIERSTDFTTVDATERQQIRKKITTKNKSDRMNTVRKERMIML